MVIVLALLTICVMSPCLTDAACNFPREMAGFAVGDGIHYKFSIDLNAQIAVFRNSQNENVFKYLDYQNHRLYDRGEDGQCWISALDESLSLPLGMPAEMDDQIRYQYPRYPNIPRQIVYPRVLGSDVTVFLTETYRCLPQEGPFVLLTPERALATLFVFSTRPNDPPYDVTEDLCDCKADITFEGRVV